MLVGKMVMVVLEELLRERERERETIGDPQPLVNLVNLNNLEDSIG